MMLEQTFVSSSTEMEPERSESTDSKSSFILDSFPASGSWYRDQGVNFLAPYSLDVWSWNCGAKVVWGLGFRIGVQVLGLQCGTSSLELGEEGECDPSRRFSVDVKWLDLN